MADFEVPVKSGVTFIEILLGLILFVGFTIPLVMLSTGGRQNTEQYARHLEAIYIGQMVIEQIRREVILSFDNLTSEPMGPVVTTAADGQPSHYFRHFFRDRTRVDGRYPYLYDQLDNFRLAVDITPYEGLDHAKHVKVRVLYRLSPAHKEWRDVDMETVVVRCAPL